MNSSETLSPRDRQLLEHNLQHLLIQRQTLQIELTELLNALGELDKSPEPVYRVLGNIMMKADKASLKKELEEKKRELEMRLQSLERQETALQSKILSPHNVTDDKSTRKSS